jgi:hypothetical protein
LTSPTYTLTSDTYPDGSQGVQKAVTALGGTQTGVETHSVSKPFTMAFARPKSLRTLGPANPVTGYVAQVARNRWSLIIRKGVEINSNGQVAIAIVRCQIEIPAGADEQDPESIRAMMSAFIGALSDTSADVGDSLITGLL